MSRPRGYATWNPKPETMTVLADVKEVLREYSAHLPLTARQIFYRLVGQYGFDKTERAYARLCEYLVRARRAQMIPFEAIRDDGTMSRGGGGYYSPADFWESVKTSANYYNRDKLQAQPVHVELWCEASGMLPQLARVAQPYSIPVYSTGGFSSVTVTYEIADRALSRDKPTVFLHVGDYDPSGESIFSAMTRDAQAFLLNRLIWEIEDGDREGNREDIAPDGAVVYGADLADGYPNLLATRVALTADQVEEYDLPTAPPKATDTRSVNWRGETCQLEAMAPDDLAAVVTEAIVDVLDLDLLERIRAEQDTERREISAHVAQIMGDKS